MSCYISSKRPTLLETLQNIKHTRVESRPTFYPFSRLSSELRLKISEHTLLPRYIRLISNRAIKAVIEEWEDGFDDDDTNRQSTFGAATHASSSVIEHCSHFPVAIRANRESREVILPIYPLYPRVDFKPTSRLGHGY
jgi:hypothetical protein